MARKTYDQYCGIATALDRVGDRWTLLILRELSFGPCRFTDLRASLPGVATNLLTERFREQEAEGLVAQRELPAPASRTVYALTEEGKRIRPVLRALFGFGLPYLADPDEREVRPRMAVHGALSAVFDPVAAVDVDLVVGFALTGSDDEPLALQVKDGRLFRPEPGAQPDLTVAGDPAALVAACRGRSLAELAPRLRITGSSAARRAFVAAFALAA